MQDRRVFLKVIGGSVIALGAAPLVEGCGDEVIDNPTGGSGGNAGSGGAGGAGGATSSAGGATSTSVSAGGATSSSSSGCGVLPPGVVAGTPDLYTTEGLHKVPGTKLLIGRDAAGLYALSALCTHKSCNMSTSSGKVLANGGIRCNCHGSNFDSLGNVTSGIATKPLPCYKLELGCDGQLYADSTTPADRNTDRVTTG